MIIFLFNRKIVCYAAYLGEEYDDEMINELYQNRTSQTENDATLITDIQIRTNKRKRNINNLISFDFDYFNLNEKTSQETKEVLKQQVIDIFTSLKFIKIYEQCVDNIEIGMQIEKLLTKTPEEEIIKKCSLALDNSKTLYNVLKLLQEEEIVDEKCKSQDILQPGNIDELMMFVEKNRLKEKPKFLNKRNIKKLY